MLVTAKLPEARQVDAGRTALPLRERLPASLSGPLLRRYQQFGGLLDGDEVANRLRSGLDQPISSLALWIVRREVLVLPCESVLLLPLFQFDFEAGRVKPAVTAAPVELRPVFDEWELASWFATPNTLLNEKLPLARVDGDGRAVLEAARTDRFIASG